MKPIRILRKVPAFVVRKSPLLLVVLPGILILSVILFWIVPEYSELVKLNRGNRQLRQNIRNISRDTERVSEDRISQWLADAKDAKGRIPDRDAFYDYLEQVRQLGNSLGIEQISYFRGAGEELSLEDVLSRTELGKLSFLQESTDRVLWGLPVKMRFQCGYRSLYRFLKILRSGRRLTDIREVKVKRIPGTLQVELSTEIYYLAPAGEEKDAA